MSDVAFIVIAVVAIGAMGLAGFQAWYLPRKTKDLVDLFMVREAKALERINRRAKEAKNAPIRNQEQKAQSNAMPAGNGNRRFRTWTQ